MKTILIPALALMLLHGTEHHTHEECPCPMARQQDAWCDVCDVGYVASVEVPSRYLFDVLDTHGHSLDLSTFDCDSCRTAIAAEGFCEEHHVGFVAGKVYFFRLSYELARGEIVDVSRIECPVCRKNARTRGWCETCKIGMVGRVAIHDGDAYRRITQSIHILHLANEAAKQCEDCAAALVTDTECPVCRILYRDGKALPRAQDARASPPRQRNR